MRKVCISILYKSQTWMGRRRSASNLWLSFLVNSECRGRMSVSPVHITMEQVFYQGIQNSLDENSPDAVAV